jgi:multidrug resistance protein
MSSTFSSSALTPTVNAIANEFEVSSQVAVLITSSFLIGYFFGPMVWPGLSEIIGRRNVYLFSITAYTLLSLGQALGKNIQTVLITRFLSGLFGSSPLTNGSGVIADVWDAVGRGRAMSVFVASVFLGPILGPIMGAFVVANDSMGWRWTVWILVIISGTVSVASVFLLPETFAPFLLVQKASPRIAAEEPEADNIENRQDGFGSLILLRMQRCAQIWNCKSGLSAVHSTKPSSVPTSCSRRSPYSSSSQSISDFSTDFSTRFIKSSQSSSSRSDPFTQNWRD